MDLEQASAAERCRRGEELLAIGQYAEGFRLYDAWREVYPQQWVELPVPRWQGEDLSGKTFLITGEQGFGDQIMFARFAKLLQEAGADVVWLCEPGLVRLLNHCGIRAASRERSFDFGVSLYSPSSALPNLFFPPLAGPPSATYIPAVPAVRRAGCAIGVVPAGNPKHVNDAARSLPDDLAAELFALPGAFDLRPESTGARDFYDTASVIAGLDLVISVDTAVAHLAGAMGKPVWVLLPFHAEWRWLRERSDSPWYPSARLFRQAAPGHWQGVIDDVRRAISSSP